MVRTSLPSVLQILLVTWQVTWETLKTKKKTPDRMILGHIMGHLTILTKLPWVYLVFYFWTNLDVRAIQPRSILSLCQLSALSWKGKPVDYLLCIFALLKFLYCILVMKKFFSAMKKKTAIGVLKHRFFFSYNYTFILLGAFLCIFVFWFFPWDVQFFANTIY